MSDVATRVRPESTVITTVNCSPNRRRAPGQRILTEPRLELNYDALRHEYQLVVSTGF
jgi:hypothetical protein